MSTTDNIATPETGTPPPMAAAAAPTATLGTRTTRGMMWMSVQTVAMKFVTFASQIALSRYLKKDDFGMATNAFTATAFLAPISQVGAREVLLRNASEFDDLYAAAIWVTTLFGLLCSTAMVLTLPLALRFFYGANALQTHPREGQELVGLVALIAISVFINSFAYIFMARLQLQLRFRLVSALTFAQSAGLVLISVFFAWRGWGAYSLVISWPIVALVRLFFLLSYAKPPRSWRPNFRRWGLLLRGGSTLLAVRLCGTFISYGDYLMLAYYANAATVGVYAFAFNLSMQTITLLSSNVDSVLFPALSSIHHDAARQRGAFLSGLSLLALVGVPLCFLQAALAGPGVRLIFQPRWYSTIPVIQILSIGMAMRLFVSPSQSLMQAQGHFSRFLAVTIGCAIVFMGAVTIGARHGNERAVAVAVSTYFALEGPALILISLGASLKSARDAARAIAFPVVAGATAAGAGALSASLLPAWHYRDLVSLFTTTMVAILIYGILVMQFSPQLWRMLLHRLRPKWDRPT